MCRILVIEDNQEILANIEEVLGLEGFDVDVAITIQTGLAKAQIHHPDLILCDWQLPDGTGAEIIAHLPNIKTIIVSASGIRLGSDLDPQNRIRYVTKPFQLAVLVRAVQNMLAS